MTNNMTLQLLADSRMEVDTVAVASPLTGYLHPGYAESLAGLGNPLALPRCGGWLLERPIHGSNYTDAMGCYPLFACREWDELPLDFESLPKRLVSVCLVTDPFADFRIRDIRHVFDLFVPFKQHYVTDLRQSPSSILSSRHRKIVRRALRNVDVERCFEPSTLRDDLITLYAHVRAKRNISGFKAFSNDTLERQLSLPGLVAYRGRSSGSTVAVLLCYLSGVVAYGHILVSNDAGYDLMASHALFWYALHDLRRSAEWLDLGGIPGISNKPPNGIGQFKSRWATDTRTTFLCGKILRPSLYDSLVASNQKKGTRYFPAYRSGELTDDHA